jgi:hypothetical protein
MESTFPTLKRGANEHYAYGAAARTLFIQQSIKPSLFSAICGTSEAVPFQNSPNY